MSKTDDRTVNERTFLSRFMAFISGLFQPSPSKNPAVQVLGDMGEHDHDAGRYDLSGNPGWRRCLHPLPPKSPTVQVLEDIGMRDHDAGRYDPPVNPGWRRNAYDAGWQLAEMQDWAI